MMKWLRGQVAKIIFGVLLIAFLSWIVLELGMRGKTGSGAGVVATVNGEKILAQEFWMIYNQELEGIWGNMRDRLTDADEKAIRKAILERLVDHTLLFQEAKRLKYSVGEKEVEANIRSVPAFINRQGQFDPRFYQAALNRLGVSHQVFEAMQKRSLSVARLQGFLRELVRVTDDELWVEYLRWHRRLKAKVLAYPFSAARPGIKVTDAEVKAYWRENKRQFEKPERVRIRHIVAAVNPQAGPESAAQARAKIESVAADLKSGVKFEELAKTRSDDSSTQPKGGDLGWHPRGELIPEYENVAFKLKSGQVSGIFETKFGYHIVKCESHLPEEKPTFEEVRGRIREDMIMARAREIQSAFAARASLVLKREKEIAKAAGQDGPAVIDTGWFEKGKVPPTGLSKSAVSVLVVGLAPLENGEFTEILAADDGFYIAQLIDAKYVRAPVSKYMDEREELERTLLGRKQNAVEEAWIVRLRAEGDVEMLREVD